MQIVENYPEKNKKTKLVETKKRVWAESIVRIMDLIEHGHTGQELMYQLFEEGKPMKGAPKG